MDDKLESLLVLFESGVNDFDETYDEIQSMLRKIKDRQFKAGYRKGKYE